MEISWPHLFVDAYDSPHEILNHKTYIKQFMTKLVTEIDMQLLGEPLCVKLTKNEHTDPGVSCICMIATSHISIHTFPYGQSSSNIYRPFYVFDCFSCQPFNPDYVVTRLSQMMQHKVAVVSKHERLTNTPQ